MSINSYICYIRMKSPSSRSSIWMTQARSQNAPSPRGWIAHKPQAGEKTSIGSNPKPQSQELSRYISNISVTFWSDQKISFSQNVQVTFKSLLNPSSFCWSQELTEHCQHQECCCTKSNHRAFAQLPAQGLWSAEHIVEAMAAMRCWWHGPRIWSFSQASSQQRPIQPTRHWPALTAWLLKMIQQ